jgi:hypothetical protein
LILGHRDLGQSDVPGLASAHGLRHRAPGFLQRHARIDPVELIEIYIVGSQPAKASVNRFAHMLGASVASCTGRRRTRCLGVIGCAHDQPDLGGQNSALAIAARQRATNQNLIGVWAICISCVDQRHTEFERPVDHRNRRCVVPSRLQFIGRRHPHAAEADDPDLGPAIAECCDLHAINSPCRRGTSRLRLSSINRIWSHAPPEGVTENR